jgi:hypothetical protein
VNPSIEDCFLPAELDWLDGGLIGPKDTETSTASISIPHTDGNDKVQPALSKLSLSSQIYGIDGNGGLSSIPAPLRSFVVSEGTRKLLQLDLQNHSQYTLPSAQIMTGYIERYFKTFHQHMPFLHQASWTPENAATPLILAICANGALYSLDAEVGRALHTAAVSSMTSISSGVCALQTTMLLIAFAAWSDEVKDLGLALKLRGGITLMLRQEWATNVEITQPMSWSNWIDAESKKR